MKIKEEFELRPPAAVCVLKFHCCETEHHKLIQLMFKQPIQLQ